MHAQLVDLGYSRHKALPYFSTLAAGLISSLASLHEMHKLITISMHSPLTNSVASPDSEQRVHYILGDPKLDTLPLLICV